ncbi:MAG: sterol desaturase family protein [Marinoscillum sp.]
MVNIILKYLSVPVLLLFGWLLSSLTITFQWNYELAAVGIFLFTSVLILILEKIIPLKSEWKTKREETAIDIKHLLSAAIFDALGKAFALGLILFIYRWFDSGVGVWERLPFVLVFVIANIASEFLPYVYHRISHVGKPNSVLNLFLWKVHSIHHLPVSLNWFKTSWIHPVNMFLNTFLKYGVLMLLGFDEGVIFVIGITHVMIAYLSHANIDSKTGVLDYVIVTPKVHQFHHSKDLKEARNFGNILPFWDLVFNTYYNRKGTVEEVGVTETDYTYPEQTTLIKQWLFPLYAGRNCCSSK